jgi:hypothetical protein
MIVRVTYRLLPALLLFVLARAPWARAQTEDFATLDRLVELNRKALDAFAAGGHEKAKDGLLAAVVLAKEHGLNTHQMTARTYLHLGVVYLGGLKDRERAVRYFGMALKLRPDIQITPSLVTPQVREAFEAAKSANKTSEPPPPAEQLAEAAPTPPRSEAPPPPPAASPARVAPAEAPPPSVDQEEPDLPAQIPQALYCPIPESGPPSEAMALRCVTQPTLKVTRLTLHFRAQGQEKWKSAPMPRTKKGWYTGAVPASAATGPALQYYVEARNGNRLAASAGRAASPNQIELVAGAPAVGSGTLAALRLPERPVHVEPETATADAAEAETHAIVHRREPRQLFIALGVGSGLGIFVTRSLEQARGKELRGFGALPAALGHFSPEVGLQWTPRLAFTLQSRHQWIPISGKDDDAAGRPATWALAVLARAYYHWRDLDNLQIAGTASLGAGTAFRLRVPADERGGLPRSDTIDGGPVVLGPGALCLYHLNRHFALAGEMRMLVGLHKFATLFDLSVGSQLTF